MLEQWRRWARTLKHRIHALYLAARHPRTPWYAKILALIVVGYAFSPIDLIPDPIPILGYLDDLVLLPVGIWLVLKLIPAAVWAECEAQAEHSAAAQHPRNWIAAGLIVVLWLAAFYFVGRSLWPLVHQWYQT